MSPTCGQIRDHGHFWCRCGQSEAEDKEMAEAQGKSREPDVNKLIGRLLSSRLSGVIVMTEEENIFKEEHRLRPDIFIFSPNQLSVIIECEFYPAYDVVEEAIDRLGYTLKRDNSEMIQTVALVLPCSLKNLDEHDLNDAIQRVTYKFCVFHSGSNEVDDFEDEDGYRECDFESLVSLIKGLTTEE